MTVSNVASTMVTMLVNNPLVEQLDLSSLRLLSCGGSPQSPAVVARAVAVFGCEFFLSYGMTETCGKISMSILPEDLGALSGGSSGAAAACTVCIFERRMAHALHAVYSPRIYHSLFSIDT